MQFWQLKNWLKNICNTSVYYIERNSKYGCSVTSFTVMFVGAIFIHRSDLNGKMNCNFR